MLTSFLEKIPQRIQYMNRRKAVKKILLLGGGAAIGYSGIKGYNLFKNPDIGLLNQRVSLLNELAETIIPVTANEPGAKSANAGSFIVNMISDCSSRKNQNNFIDGIKDVIQYSMFNYYKPFEECSMTEKNNILQHFEKKGKFSTELFNKANRFIFGDSFFYTLKKYTVLGFCNSKIGATQALSYDYLPGKYIASKALLPNQKGWATF